jgi:glycerol-3-phosphate dehydrogenase
MNRDEMLSRVVEREGEWDIIIIGGGATGIGCAVDAASRGYEVLLLEQSDFGKGTSSRSTKLVHGGVRYLEQGNISLVMEALKERGILKGNAPHLVKELAFIVPNYEWWEMPFYGIGLKIYNLLSGQYGFGKSKILTKAQTLKRLPTIRAEGLRGGVIYYDGQFDDTELLLSLALTAHGQGAVLLNYARVFSLTKDAEGLVDGVNFIDEETGQLHRAKAKVVINAAGPFCDTVRRFSDDGSKPIISPSQGIHLVFDKSFLPTRNAIMIPHTSDGRVLFAIPWHGHTLVGTTDTPVEKAELEPRPLSDEIDFVLKTAGEYLYKSPTRNDILSVFAGVRPLVKAGDAKSTSSLSRDHTIEIDNSGLVTITGGKWTTYRRMAEDCINQAANLAGLPERECLTRSLKIHQSPAGRGEKLDERFSYTLEDVVRTVREEMARTVEDVLARRLRILFLNARAAIEVAPTVAALMAAELGRDEAWQLEQVQSFNEIAKNYLVGNIKGQQ